MGQRWRFALMLVLVVQGALFTLLGWPGSAAAAQLQQVRTASLLQVGDSNRSYSVRLACIEVAPDQEQRAVQWLRHTVDRGSRLNLRPLGESDGQLLARVTSLARPRQPAVDLGAGLVAAGLATPLGSAVGLPAEAPDPACGPFT
jgi:hypothetical protein